FARSTKSRGSITVTFCISCFLAIVFIFLLYCKIPYQYTAFSTMTLSTFSFPTTILFGAGAIGELPKELAKRAVLRPLLVTDAGLARSAIFERVSKLIPAAVVYS